MDSNKDFLNEENHNNDAPQSVESNTEPTLSESSTETAIQSEHEAKPQDTASEINPETTASKETDSEKIAKQSTEAPDLSKYRAAAPTYASTPDYSEARGTRETVYVNTTPPRDLKKPKAKMSIGAAIALIAVCALFSGITAFAGTAIANKMGGSTVITEDGTVIRPGAGEPSVVFQSFDNKNKTPGTYEQVAEAVSDSVVEITTESIVTDSVFWGGNYVTSGAGSGVIVSSDGLIITNNHVVSGASTITVRLTDGTEYKATVIGADSDSDIAVIKIEAADLKFALIGNSDELRVGEEVLAVGNPLGELGGTVTNGIISALSRDVSIDGTSMNLLQTNAAVNPGNSGGGLFNMYGELIGIVNAKSSTTSSGTSVEGIGFAIPSNTAIKVATELTNYGYVRGKAMIGITYIDITNSYDAMYYRVNSLGVYVASSEVDTLKSGDRIVAINGTEVTYGADVKAALKGLEVGTEITVTVVRDGKYVEAPVTLREYVPETATTDTSKFEYNFGQ